MIEYNDFSVKFKQILNGISAVCVTKNLPLIADICTQGVHEIDEPLRVAIVGTTSVGKSTLLNALIKRNLVPTGAETLTYNVNVLRHVSRSLNSQEQILVHFKGGHVKPYPITFFSHLVDGREKEYQNLRDKVAWVEAFIDYDYLKNIDLIDTPGLLSTKGRDSENTIELFRDKVRCPDVIVYLMQREIHYNDIEAISNFQSQVSSGSTSKTCALNTVGALTHCDYLCKNDFEKNIHTLGQDLIDKNRNLHAGFRSCFTKIFTISAIYAQSAYTMESNDFQVLKQLLNNNEICEDLLDGLYNKKAFIDDSFKALGDIINSKDERESFLNRLDLSVVKYAIWWLKNHPQSNINTLKKHLVSYSGVQYMDEFVFNYFNNLKTYFKATKLLSGIFNMIKHLSCCYMNDNQKIGLTEIATKCKEYEYQIQNEFSFLSILVDYYNNETYFSELDWKTALDTIDLCLNKCPDRKKLLHYKSIWEDNQTKYSIISDLVAIDSCQCLLNQIELQL